MNEDTLLNNVTVLSLPRGGLFIGNLNDVRGSVEIKPPIYERFAEINKCIRSNGMLENGLVYLY